MKKIVLARILLSVSVLLVAASVAFVAGFVYNYQYNKNDEEDVRVYEDTINLEIFPGEEDDIHVIKTTMLYYTETNISLHFEVEDQYKSNAQYIYAKLMVNNDVLFGQEETVLADVPTQEYHRITDYSVENPLLDSTVLKSNLENNFNICIYLSEAILDTLHGEEADLTFKYVLTIKKGLQ